MRKILIGLLLAGAVSAATFATTSALFNDTETSQGNVLAAGTLDLTVDDQNDPLGVKFGVTNMAPGDTYNVGHVSLKNAGSLDGTLTLSIVNPVSNENGLEEPETDAGDSAGVEVDTTGYNANTGDGELWDQTTFRICLDTGAGSHSTNLICDWDDVILYSNNGTPGNDYSSTYSIPLSLDLASDNNYTLSAGSSVNLIIETTFLDDESTSWWGGLSGMSNNQAMGDNVEFDVVFGLEQL